MSPEFSSAVDPIISYALRLINDIESGRMPVPEDANVKMRGLFDSAENRLGARQDWELAKYALCGWIDDLLIEAPWEGRSWWEENRMEFELFRSGDAFTVFFLQAKKAGELPNKDALEVFYICVVLGFRGIYGDSTAIAHAEDFGLLPSLEVWAKRTSLAIQHSKPPKVLELGTPGPGAPPLEGKYLLIGSGVLCLLLGVVTAALAFRAF